MKVLIDGVLIDSDVQPITLMLSDEDKELIRDMGEASVFCRYPDDRDPEEIKGLIDEMLSRGRTINPPVRATPPSQRHTPV